MSMLYSACMESLPLELYRPIIQYLTEKRDILSLCLVSQRLRSEANYALYHHVQLKGAYQIFAWSKATEDFPHLSQLTHAISIPTRACLSNGRKRTFAQALATLVNLKELRIKHQLSESQCSDGYLLPWMLEDVSEQLELFHSELGEYEMGFKCLTPFFISHPHIRYLHWTGGDQSSVSCTPEEIDSTLLPRLSTIHLDHWRVLGKIPNTRSVRRLRLGNISLSEDTLHQLGLALEPLSDTLTHLSVDILATTTRKRDQSRQPCLSDILQTLITALPNLHFLQVNGDLRLGSEPRSDIMMAADTLNQFKNLEVFMLDLSRLQVAAGTGTLQHETPKAPDFALERWEDCAGVAKQVMHHACGQLQYVGVGWKGNAAGRHFQKEVVAFGRGEGGEVDRKSVDFLSDESWAKW